MNFTADIVVNFPKLCYTKIKYRKRRIDMGIIRAAVNALGGSLGDQWLEVIEADNMSDTTVFCSGKTVRKNDR